LLSSTITIAPLTGDADLGVHPNYSENIYMLMMMMMMMMMSPK